MNSKETTYVVTVPVAGEPSILPFEAGNSYEQISKAVGGYIEAVILPAIKTAGNYGITCFVNEEGLLKGLPLNAPLTLLCKTSYGGPLVGDAIFVGTDDEGETVGLTHEDAQTIIDDILSARKGH